jgi:hypothetical protein
MVIQHNIILFHRTILSHLYIFQMDLELVFFTPASDKSSTYISLERQGTLLSSHAASRLDSTGMARHMPRTFSATSSQYGGFPPPCRTLKQILQEVREKDEW